MSYGETSRSAVVRRMIVTCVMLCMMGMSSARAVEKPTTEQASCVTEQCHADYAKKTHVHAPVQLGDCKSCHRSLDVSQHTFKSTREGKDLCEFCHLEQSSRQNVHDPLVKGKCTDCHDPHSSEGEFLLKAPTVGELCAQCHKEGQGLSHPHGPVAVGQCTMCHDSHSADHKALLLDEPTNLCFSCHVVTKEELQQYEFIHEPARNDCIGCHDAHGANNAKMLKASAPDLCYSCHTEIKDTAEKSKYKHSAVTQKESCNFCHTPHASTVQYGLKAAPGELCLSCHKEGMVKPNGETLEAFTKQIENKKYLHGPVAQKDCKGCHVTHGSDHFRLLAEEYPARFYAPFKVENYKLCFSCHQESLVLTEKTAELTDFRNGDRNLHYVHVNKPQRGRTCRSCHATHASDEPKHIRESVPYGAWDLPINYAKSETGGRCAPGCHVPYSYDRNAAVVYEKK